MRKAKRVPVSEKTLFKFSVKNKVGAVPLVAVVNQLRCVAGVLEKSQVDGKVMFELRVWEDKREGKRETFTLVKSKEVSCVC